MSLDKEKSKYDELENKISDDIRDRVNEITPKIDQTSNEIEKLKDDEKLKEGLIITETQRLLALTEKKIGLIQQNQDIKIEIEKQYNEVQQIRDEPTRFSKQADMLQTANDMMNKDLMSKLEEVQKRDKEIIALNEKKSQRHLKILEIEDKIAEEIVKKGQM